MVKLSILVFHSGQWDDRQYNVEYKTICVLVDGGMLFDSFVNLIRSKIHVDSLIELSVFLDTGSNGVQNVLKDS